MRKFLRKRTSDCKVKHPDLGNARLEVAHTFLTYVCYDTKDTHKLLSVSAFRISVVTYVGHNRGKLIVQPVEYVSIEKKHLFTVVIRNNKSRHKPRTPREEKFHKVLFWNEILCNKIFLGIKWNNVTIFFL